MQHRPDNTGWQHIMQPVHDLLKESAASRELPPLEHVDPSVALREFESSGQGGLDALLAAFDSESASEVPPPNLHS